MFYDMIIYLDTPPPGFVRGKCLRRQFTQTWRKAPEFIHGDISHTLFLW